MTLKNILKLISKGTKIKICVDDRIIFIGCMCEIGVAEWKSAVGEYLNNKVRRIDNFNGYIILIC